MSERPIEIEIPEELIRQFEALPAAGLKRKPYLNKQKIELLRRYWPIKRKTEVARLLNISKQTARKYYKLYAENQDA
jgi:hypothetical protein